MTTTAHDPLNVGRRAGSPDIVFCAVSAQTFERHFQDARVLSEQVRDATSCFDLQHPDAAATCYVVTSDGKSGFAVRPDGELVYVFSTVKGRGDRIVRMAVTTGALYLDCFDGYLTTLYGRNGFEVSARVPNWTRGGPEVVYMNLPGYAHRHGVGTPQGIA